MEKTGKLKWKHVYDECFLEIWVEGNYVYYEDGPAYLTARGHEGTGGSQTIAEFISKPMSVIGEFPGLHREMFEALKREGIL